MDTRYPALVSVCARGKSILIARILQICKHQENRVMLPEPEFIYTYREFAKSDRRVALVVAPNALLSFLAIAVGFAGRELR